MSYPERTPAWRRYLRLIRGNVSSDVDLELRFHFASRIEELIASGEKPDSAREQALREFGNVDDVREHLVSIGRRVARRRSRGESLLDVLADAGYAFRSLARAPGVAIAIVATLALGIGANAAMFTFLDAVFLRPPPGVIDPDGIRRVWAESHFSNGAEFWSGYSYAQFDAVRQAVGSRGSLAIYTSPIRTKIGTGERAVQAEVSNAAAEFFTLTGATPEMGRLYSHEEDAFELPAPVAVVSHRYWQQTLDGDEHVLGRTIVIGGIRHTIIGVLREPFLGVDLDAGDIWRPLAFEVAGNRPDQPWWKNPNVNGFNILFRPARGVAESSLEAALTTVLRRPVYGFVGDTLTVVRLGSIIAANGPGNKSQEVRIAVRLAAVAAIVLLIACANVVNLLLASAVKRRREIAVRLALGIARWRLVRLLLVECAVLGLASAAVALVVAYSGGTLLRKLLLPNNHWGSSAVDWRVTLFALSVAMLAGVAAGLIPALQAARTDVTNSLKAGGTPGATQRSSLRAGLVVAQAALSVVLLCGAALFVRSLSNVRALDMGYDTAGLITASVEYDDHSVRNDATVASRLSELQSRVAAIPGVKHVALSDERPMYSISWLTFFTATDSSRKGFSPTFTAVSPGYFAAAGLRILHGEDFAAQTNASEQSVVVNEAMAKAAWPGRQAIGECIRFGARKHPCFRVIGVVETARERGLIEDPQPKFYLRLGALPEEARRRQANYVVANVDPQRAAAISSELRVLVRQQFPGGIPSIVRLSDYLEPQYRPWRVGAALFAAFGVLAFIVAAIGIYSSVAYSANQRLHEFGIRIALGARLADVFRIVVGGGLRIVAIGVVVGVGLALATGRFVAALLYGVSPSSPAVLVLVAAVLLAAGLVAAIIPAWRAGRVDPVVALRAD